MKRTLSFLVSAITGFFLLLNATAWGGSDMDSVVDSFEKHVQSLEATDGKLKAAALEAISEYKSDSAADAITEGLIALYPEYEQAIESTDSDDVLGSIEMLTKVSGADDKYLAADASFYLARRLMNDERFEAALPLLDELRKELKEFSVHLPTVQYYRGVAQSGLLQNEDAVDSFMAFLQFNPDAPERLRVNAWRQVQEIQSAGNDKMEEVHQRMDFSRRRLRLTESNEGTQVEQDKIVKLLSQMIKEQEKKECSKCNSDKPNTKKQQQKSPQKQAKKQSPKPSKGQKGGSSNNPNGIAQKTYDDSPASPWSRLRDRSRDPENKAMKQQLPARYRDIVERYYEAANGNGTKK